MASFADIKKKLTGYHNQNKTAGEIIEVTNEFRHLKIAKPISSSCEEEDALNKTCISLVGTIPVHTRGDTYNIPVSIQVRQNHPQSAPHVYVKPTADMEIVVSDMVKDTGRVNIPYLSEWNQQFSDLVTLAQMMSMTFAEKCPVQAKSAPAPPPSYDRYTSQANPPPTRQNYSGGAGPAPSSVYNPPPPPSVPQYNQPPRQNYYPPPQASQSDQFYQRQLADERARYQQMLADERARADNAEKRLADSQMTVGQTQQALFGAEQRTSYAEERQERLDRELKETQKRLQEAEQGQVVAMERERAVQRGAVDREEQQFWIIGKDEIQLEKEELGTGGWATVKVATFRHLRVAAKHMHQVIISDYNRALFVREMNMAARMRHPNIVQFIGANIEGEAVILTELMPTSLRAQYAKQTLTYPQVISISEDVAKGLNYLHLMKPDPMIHRDISSANVLLEPLRDNKWRAKICDCGSANFVQRTNTAGPGNPTYAAPEADTPKLQTTKMDVYSYGILLLETNTQRFPDPRTRELLFNMLGHRPEMVALIRDCMVVAPSNRPSMEDILVRLEDMIGRYTR